MVDQADVESKRETRSKAFDGQVSAKIGWEENDTPISLRFRDTYYSRQGGLEESRHVFLGGNDLTGRLKNGFRICELGFGTGLNLLAALRVWEKTGRRGIIQYTSFEAYPMAVRNMRRSLSAFPELSNLREKLLGQLSCERTAFRIGSFQVEIIIGDAGQTLPIWEGSADAWFLDGFAPARNPEMWHPDLLREVGRKTVQGGTFATFTSAGSVRRALQSAGFEVRRTRGYAGKRHMMRGRKE